MLSEKIDMRIRQVRRYADGSRRLFGVALKTVLVVAGVALVALLVVVPKVYEGMALTVLTGSMEPAFDPGDVVVVKGVSPGAVCAEVPVGAVVTFLPEPADPTLITHRVVGKTVGDFEDGTVCRLTTRGDANTAWDDPISPEQVRGVVMFGIPKIGWARQWAAQHLPVVLGALFAVLVVWLLPGSKAASNTDNKGTPPQPSTVAGPADHEFNPVGETIDEQLSSTARPNSSPIN